MQNYYSKYFLLAFLLNLIFGCARENELQVQPNNTQAYSVNNNQTDSFNEKRISLIISELGNKDNNSRQKAIVSLIYIANENSLSRSKVVNKLIIGFDNFRKDKKQIILPDEKEELNAYLKLFLDLQAIEALDVMVKYIGSKELVSRQRTLIGKTIIQFGEDAIPSLEKGLNYSDEGTRCESALTMCNLNFKCEPELGKNKAIEILENARKNESAKYVSSCIENAIRTLKQQ